MPRGQFHSVLHFLRTVAAGAARDATDRQLLERFATRRDEDAFAALLVRHGPMVLGVCRRALDDPHDAEDAFQATFLVLARKAGSLARPELLGNWLFGVAARTAARARAASAARRAHERPEVPDVLAPDPLSELLWRDLRPVLDAEIDRLPARYRAPFVLCYLEGRTYEEAARLLGCPLGTLSTRLTRARERLRVRLTRRGLALSSGVLAALLSQNVTTAAVPPLLLDATAKAALCAAAGQLAGVVSASVLVLMKGVLHAMFIQKLKTVVFIVLAVGIVGAGTGGVVSYGTRAAEGQEAPAHVDAGRRDATRGEIQRLGQENQKLRDDLEALRKQVADLQRQRRDAEQDVTKADPPDRRKGGKEVLRFQGKPAEYWLNQLKDRDPAYRQTALTALAAIAEEDEKTIPIIAAALKDKSYNVRATAAGLLGELGTPALQAIRRAAKESTVQNRDAIIRALFSFGEDTIPDLMEIYRQKDTSMSLRTQVADTLAGKGQVAVPHLAEMLKDPDVNIQARVLQYLGNQNTEAKAAAPAVIALLQTPKSRWHENNETLSTLLRIDPEGPDTLAVLIEAAKSKNTAHCHFALDSLRVLGPKAAAAVPTLIDLLANDNDDTRSKASNALKRVDPKGVERRKYELKKLEKN